MRYAALTSVVLLLLSPISPAQDNGKGPDIDPTAVIHTRTGLVQPARTGTAVPPPTNLTATAGNAQVNLSWTASSGASSYNVKRGPASGAETTMVNVTNTSFLDTGVTNNITYFYVVSAVSSTGKESSNSNEVSATPTAPSSPPAAPTGLSATAGNTQVTLSWTPSSGATSYNVGQGTAPGAETTIATNVASTSYVSTGLTNGVTYYFVVSAVNSFGTSANSSEVSASPSAPQAIVVGPVVPPTTSIPEAEEHIAVDPKNSNNLVAAISDFALRGLANTTKYAVSSTNGATWVESYVPLVNGSPATGDGQVWPYNSDPVVAIDTLGNVFLIDLYFHQETGNNANGLYVSVATLSGGVNFTVSTTYTIASNLNPSTNVTEDKPWIAVDNSTTATNGNVYASWTHFVGNSDSIVFSRSTNHGVSWASSIQINPSTQNGGVQGSQVAVGPAGEVYVVYEVFFVGNQRRQFLAKSVDGGQTFSPPVAISPIFNELSFQSSYRKSSFASLSVAPNGNVYVAYADQPKGAGARVEFIKSTNGGQTFSSPVVLNDAASGQHFMQALTTDAAGTIHVSWFDTRLTGTSSQYDIFATRSTDNGMTFFPNARVTPTSINAGNTNFIGDYAGIAAGGGSAHPVWTSGGFNNGRLQTATLQ